MRYCNNCGAPLAPDALFCTECGSKNILTCHNCGAQLPPDCSYCTECGVCVDTKNEKTITSHTIGKKSRKNKIWLIPLIVLSTILVSILFVEKCLPNMRNDKVEPASNKIEMIITERVHSWDKMHNINSFDNHKNDLYAETVKFYGKTMKGDEALKRIYNALQKNPNYSQMSTNIKVTVLSKNRICCEFDKHSTMNGKTTVYPSYMCLVNLDNDNWRIIEESDSLTDYYLRKR